MTNDPGEGIARRDEVLELLYWIEGEGFSGAATLNAIARFLTYAPDLVRGTLEDLVVRGDATHNAVSGEYRLSDTGRREAARRFAEELSPLLAQGHGECNDPTCDCHSDPMSARECDAARGPYH